VSQVIGRISAACPPLRAAGGCPNQQVTSPAAIAQGRSRHEWTRSEAAARGVELARRGCDRAVEFDHVIENVPKRKPASTSSGSRAIVSCRLLLAGSQTRS